MEKRICEDGIELREEGKRLGRISLRKQNGVLTILSTYVDPAARGRGLASALVEAALKLASEANLEVASECSFASSYIERKRAAHG